MKTLFTLLVLLFVSSPVFADNADLVESDKSVQSLEAKSDEAVNEAISELSHVESEYLESVNNAQSDYEQRLDYLENTNYDELEKKATRGAAGMILASVATIAAIGNPGLVAAGAAITVGSVFYVKDSHKALSDKRTLGHE